MSVAVRSPERSLTVSTDRLEGGANQRRMEDAFRILSAVAVRIVTDANPSVYSLDLASQDGVLQTVWCRDGSSSHVPIGTAVDALEVSSGAYGPINAERYLRAQKALSVLLLELTRPECTGSATLKVRGRSGEFADEIHGECHRRWRF